jgi:hypothetical protein
MSRQIWRLSAWVERMACHGLLNVPLLKGAIQTGNNTILGEVYPGLHRNVLPGTVMTVRLVSAYVDT